MNILQGSWDVIKDGTSTVIHDPVNIATTLLSCIFVVTAYATGLLVLVLMCMSEAHADGINMECKLYGYASTAEEFHSIVTEELVNQFSVAEDKVFLVQSGSVYTAIDPTTVGFDSDVATYASKFSHEVLYIYMVDGKPEIGVSLLVPDSDTFFNEKQLFTDCSPVPTKQQVAGNVIRTQLAGVVQGTPAFTF